MTSFYFIQMQTNVSICTELYVSRQDKKALWIKSFTIQLLQQSARSGFIHSWYGEAKIENTFLFLSKYSIEKGIENFFSSAPFIQKSKEILARLNWEKSWKNLISRKSVKFSQEVTYLKEREKKQNTSKFICFCHFYQKLDEWVGLFWRLIW